MAKKKKSKGIYKQMKKAVNILNNLIDNFDKDIIDKDKIEGLFKLNSKEKKQKNKK